MALPVTISGVAFPTQNYYIGPFLSGGNVYVVLLDSSDLSLVEVHKATDPTDSFSEQDSGNKPDHIFNIIGLWAEQVGTDLHISQSGHNGSTSHRVHYGIFHMATDLWDTLVDDFVAQAQNVVAGDCASSLVVRSGGDVVIFFTGDHDTEHGTERSRVDYTIRTTSWSSLIAVDDGGAQSWLGAVAILGLSSRVHFLFKQSDDDEAYQRTLSAADALETFPSAGDSAVSGIKHVFAPGISYDDSGTQRIRVPYVDFGGRLSYAEFDSVDAPGAFTINANVSDLAVSGAGGSPNACLAVDGLDEHLLYVATIDGDIYHNKNGGTEDNVFSGSIVLRLSSNIFDRSGTKLAYIFLEGSTIKYNEVDISGGAAPVSFPPIQPAMRRPLPHVRM